jgi:hypothetical protein
VDASKYDIWAIRINEAIRAGKRRERPPEGKSEPIDLKGLLLEFAGEAAVIVGAIGRNVEDVDVLGGERSTTMPGFLDEMLKFDEFSFLEYRYKLPSKREPGLRFKVENRSGRSRIVVRFFEDLVFWAVDEEGRRIFQEPIHFDLVDGLIKAVPHPDLTALYARCPNWETALRETLALPFRHLYDPAFADSN